MGNISKAKRQQSFLRVTVLIAEMKRVLEATFFDQDYSFWLSKKQSQDVKDVKHCIRTFLMERWKASPWEMSKAESQVRRIKTDHSSMYHSRNVVQEVLIDIKPTLVQQIKERVYE